MRPALVVALAVPALLAGCLRWQPVPPGELDEPPAQRSVELDGVPFFPQTRNHCGPAALATALTASGVPVEPAALADEVYIPGREGTLQAELQAATRRHGRLAYRPRGELDALLAELHAGHPVIVFHNLGISWFPYWHYSVLVGYDAAEQVLVERSGKTRRRRTPAALFLRTWERTGRWALVTLAPGELPAAEEPQPYLEAAADFERTAGPGAAGPAWLAATRRWPAEPLPWLGLGNARQARGEHLAAASAYGEALQRRPELVAARNNLALALADAGCVRRALRELDIALASVDSGHPLAAELERTRKAIPAPGAAEPAACGG